ncbi:metallophosphoesterase [Georgenia sp. Z1344]|uniref:metallophosphoesterase n=1 Tax=Georgenia sp. Z1344 TaxID=3416706 RepID=UPI003CEF851A
MRRSWTSGLLASAAALAVVTATVPAAATPDDGGAIPLPAAPGAAQPDYGPVEPDPGQVAAGEPTVNVDEGERVSGVHTVVTTPSVAGENPANIEIDGVADEDARVTLGAEALAETDAAFVLDVTAAVEIAYSNYLMVNGERVGILEQIANVNDHPINLPADLVTLGHNEIEFHTGTRASTCGINHDDVVIGNFRLQIPGGEQFSNPANPTTGPAPGADGLYNIGDGNCGSSSKPRFLTTEFTVDAEPNEHSGLLLELDTTALEDGEHTLTVTTDAGATTERTIVVDNTGPALVSSTPTDGDHLLGDAVVTAEVADEAGVTGDVALTLDGTPIAAGTTISSDTLSEGAHELVVESTDALGTTSRHVVEFTSAPNTPGIADLSPATGTAGVGLDAPLAATVTDPHGDDVDATFYVAEPELPSAAYQGTTEELPLGQLDLTGQEEADAAPLAPGDDEVLRSPAAEGVTYQRFDVPVESDGEQIVSWSGEVDPARGARLYVWDGVELAWDLLQDARGTADGATELGGTADAQHVDDGTVHLLVEGYDPFADDIEDPVADSFRDPETYDFAIAHNTDTQYLSEGAVDQEGAAADRFRDAYVDTTQWIADNADERNIAYALHTGDLVNDDTVVTDDPDWIAHARAQYDVADEAQSILDDAGIPNGVLPGNHDNRYGNDNSLYNEYFGPERYEALSENWENAEYGGPWREGDNQNHYDLFSAGGLDFVVVHLGYLATAEELAWANEILAQYPDRNAILASHEYINASTAPDARGATHTAHWGQNLWNDVVTQNPNIVLVLSGHVHGVGTNVRHDVAEPGHHVVELLADYQEYLVDDEKTAGFMRLLQFDVDRSELTVDTYSARLDNFGANEFDSATNRDYDGTEDDFTVPIDLTTRTTSIATDSVLVTAYSDEEIGTDTVASGETATVEWSGLEPATTYGWYVVAQNATGGEAVSPVATFTTTSDGGEEPGPDPEPEPGPEPVPPTPGRGFYLNDGWDAVAEHEFSFGRVGDEVLVGDWDGDGKRLARGPSREQLLPVQLAVRRERGRRARLRPGERHGARG